MLESLACGTTVLWDRDREVHRFNLKNGPEQANVCDSHETKTLCMVQQTNSDGLPLIETGAQMSESKCQRHVAGYVPMP